MDFEKALEEAIRTLRADRATQLLNALLWWAETQDLPTTELMKLCQEFEQYESDVDNFHYILEELEVDNIQEAAKKVEDMKATLDENELEIDRLRLLLDRNEIPWESI
jgi:hypothetical protein